MATTVLHHLGRFTCLAWSVFVLLITGTVGVGFFRGEVLGLGDVTSLFGNPLLISIVGGATFLLVMLSMISLYVRPHNPRFPNHSWRGKSQLPSHVITRIQNKKTEVDTLMQTGRPSGYRSAVVLMDNLLDLALKELGYVGSLGDKLKASASRFSDLNAVWAGHKYRNRLVHDVDQEPLKLDAESAITALRQALRDLGVE